MASTGSSQVAPPAAAMHSRKVMPIGTVSETGSATAPAMVMRLVRDRLAIDGLRDVHERLDVVDDRADVDRQPAGRDEFAGDGIDQIVFVARRIEVAEQLHAHAGSLAGGLDGGDGFLLLGLDADHAIARTGRGHAEFDAAHDFRRVVLHDRRVLVQQGFALGTVGDDDLGLRGELHMGGKSAAARADDAC